MYIIVDSHIFYKNIEYEYSLPSFQGSGFADNKNQFHWNF